MRRQRALLGAPKAINASAHKLARILYNLMRHGIAYLRKEEDDYALHVRDRLEIQLHRRVREPRFEVHKLQNTTLTFPDGEVGTVDPHGEILDVH